MIRIFLKFAWYIILKWIIFYIYQFIESVIESGNQGKWWGHATNKEGLLLAAFMLFALPLVEIIVLIFPLQFALKQNGWTAIIILILSFGLEFIIGWYATNQHFEVWMIVKIIVSAGLFYLFYRKQINIF